MEGADAGPDIARAARHTHVPKLGVMAAEHSAAANNETDADSGTHSYVREVREPLGRSPALLRQCRAIHVGVKADRHAAARSQAADKVHARPSGLGRRSDLPKGQRAPPKVEWTK